MLQVVVKHLLLRRGDSFLVSRKKRKADLVSLVRAGNCPKQAKLSFPKISRLSSSGGTSEEQIVKVDSQCATLTPSGLQVTPSLSMSTKETDSNEQDGETCHQESLVIHAPTSVTSTAVVTPIWNNDQTLNDNRHGGDILEEIPIPTQSTSTADAAAVFPSPTCESEKKRSDNSLDGR